MSTITAKALDQWYTKPQIATICVKRLTKNRFLNKTHKVIEPSAGEGAFVTALSSVCSSVRAFDLDPKFEGCIQRDWLEPGQLEADVIVGNPPFGKKGKLTTEFINVSLDRAKVVAFVVPITLSSSWTAQSKVRSDAILADELELPKNAFTFEGRDVNVPCVFQVWVRSPSKRLDKRMRKPPTEHADLDIRIYNKTAGAMKSLDWDWDVAVKRNSKRGEFITKGQAQATPDYHWVLIKGSVEVLSEIDWSRANDGKMTAGIGKADVVRLYSKHINR